MTTVPDRPEFYFCANEACRLHVRAGDPGTRGSGNWATVQDGTGKGIVFGRSMVGQIYFCDPCAKQRMQP